MASHFNALVVPCQAAGPLGHTGIGGGHNQDFRAFFYFGKILISRPSSWGVKTRRNVLKVQKHQILAFSLVNHWCSSPKTLLGRYPPSQTWGGGAGGWWGGPLGDQFGVQNFFQERVTKIFEPLTMIWMESKGRQSGRVRANRLQGNVQEQQEQ